MWRKHRIQGPTELIPTISLHRNGIVATCFQCKHNHSAVISHVAEDKEIKGSQNKRELDNLLLNEPDSPATNLVCRFASCYIFYLSSLVTWHWSYYMIGLMRLRHSWRVWINRSHDSLGFESTTIRKQNNNGHNGPYSRTVGLWCISLIAFGILLLSF